MRDLKSKTAIYLKAVLFLIIGLVSGGLLLLQNLNWRTALLICLVVWSFCRAYYFAFYVMERYVDPSFRFAGLWALVRHILKQRRTNL